MRISLQAVALMAVIAIAAAVSWTATPPWQTLEPGLDFSAFPSPTPSRYGDSLIRVLRIDLQRFTLRLLNASAPSEGAPHTARDWCHSHSLVAAINASMYRADGLTSASLMRSRTTVNQPHLTKDKSILALDPLVANAPPVQLLDRECDPLDEQVKLYGTLVQNIRMVSCRGRNVWSKQPREWSTAAIGVDRQGRVLFIHTRSPYATHDLIEILLQLPLDLVRAMYVEGGPEAQLYVNAGGQEREFFGSFETGFNENDANVKAWPVPNVIGVERKTAPRAEP